MACNHSCSSQSVLMELFCPTHPSAHLIEDHRAGDIICPECGLVVGDRLVDVGTEWRSFSNERGSTDPSRVGAPENPLLGGDLSTTIAVGFGASESTQGLAYTQRKNTNNSDRQMKRVISIIREMSDRINITRAIQDCAAGLFKSILDSKGSIGQSIEAQAATCLYIACRQQEAPRTFTEICAVCNVPKKTLGRCFKNIAKLLELNVDQVTSTDLMSRFCSNLNLPRNVQVAAIHIAQEAVKLNVAAARSPISIAAAAIYMASQASGTLKTTKEIGEITGAAEQTVRHTYKLLLPTAAQLFPSDFEFAVPIDGFSK